MRIFVYEFVTGGGMAGSSLPAGLLREADLMAESLLADLAACPGVECLTTRDSRLPAPAGGTLLASTADESPVQSFQRGVAMADAVWVIAPERHGILLGLVQEVERQGRRLLGSDAATVALTASKAATTDRLRAAGIAAVPSLHSAEALPRTPGRWVTKPDDGAGAEDTLVHADWRSAQETMHRASPGMIVQPWVEGEAWSLSLLCDGGRATLLSCNRQRIVEHHGALALAGIDVNAILGDCTAEADLGTRIAAAIPGLRGYIGVDFIRSSAGPVVLEINPRLTTSFCGLRRARRLNVGALVLALGRAPVAQVTWLDGETVNLSLEGAHVG